MQGQRGEADGGGNEESEAGPEAVAAVQHAMQQYGQEDDDDNPQGARQLEQMMNAMIEQAYDEDMEVRSQSSNSCCCCLLRIQKMAIRLFSIFV